MAIGNTWQGIAGRSREYGPQKSVTAPLRGSHTSVWLARALQLHSQSGCRVVYSHTTRRLVMNKDESGFSLVEMLIVVGIIGLLAAIAIPLLRKAKNQADSGSAIATVRTLVSAERLYQLKNSKYTDLAGLVPEGTLDTTVQAGLKS